MKILNSCFTVSNRKHDVSWALRTLLVILCVCQRDVYARHGRVISLLFHSFVLRR